MSADTCNRPEFEKLRQLALGHYGERLTSLVVYGSVARGTAGPESDIDLLVVADGLPDGRLRRVEDFRPIEEAMESELVLLEKGNLGTRLSAVFKTPAEALAGSPLFLDMVEDAAVLYDRGRFFEKLLGELRDRLQALGARRVVEGERWYWVLKPDYRPGEVFEI